MQIPGFRDCMGAKVVAIASRHRERAENVAKEFGIETVCNDWQELVNHRDVDLVSIVTPPATHMEITLAALEHRKAVLCEKPMAMNAEQTARMVQQAKAAGVLALIDHELRFLNSRRTMRAMLQNGAIGKVRHCNYVFRSDYRGVKDRQWDWWSNTEMGGGTLGAIGSHAIDSFHWLLGTEIKSVLALLSTHIKQRADKPGDTVRTVTSDDEAKVLFRLVDGANNNDTTAAASLSVVESGKYENRLEVYGATGALMVEETGELWHSPVGSGHGDRFKSIRIKWPTGCARAVGREDLQHFQVPSLKLCAQERLRSVMQPPLKTTGTVSARCCASLKMREAAGLTWNFEFCA